MVIIKCVYDKLTLGHDLVKKNCIVSLFFFSGLEGLYVNPGCLKGI